jgi:hypothetical protein
MAEKPLSELAELVQEASELAAKAAKRTVEMEQTIQLNESAIVEFNRAIDFAIKDSEPAAFLIAWRSGDWDCIRKEWPTFEIDESKFS